MLLALIWQFDFPPFMVLIIAILNDGLYLLFDIVGADLFFFLYQYAGIIFLMNFFVG